MNKLIALSVVTTFIVACLSPCFAIIDDVEANEPISAEVSTNTRNIVVLTDQMMTQTYSYGNNVHFQSTFETIGQNDIVVIDGTWIETQDQTTVYSDVKSLIDDGNPILLAADSYDAISTDRIGYSTGFSPSAEIYGIIVDPNTGTTYCYSVSEGDVSKSFETALEWIDKSETDILSTRASDAVSSPTLCAITETTGGFGKTVAESKHTKYKIDNNTALILTEYNYSADPDMEDSIWDNWIAVADMEISCNHLDSDLYDHGPTSSSSNTYSVNIHADDKESGMSASGNWSYTIEESSLKDKSRYEIFDVYHDINEKGNDKLSTKVMKPGTISLATKGNNPYLYHETECYYTTFYKDSTVVSDKYADCDSELVVSII